MCFRNDVNIYIAMVTSGRVGENNLGVDSAFLYPSRQP
jgi:hypothetical protein